MTIAVEVSGRNYSWTEDELKETLSQLAASDRSTHWIKGDLSTATAGRIGRAAWPILSRYPELRERLYGVNPETTQAILDKLARKIERLDDAELTRLFKAAVYKYNIHSRTRMVEAPHKWYIENYTPPPFQVPETNLTFGIGEKSTTVTSILTVKRAAERQPLVLDGEKLNLLDLRIDGKALSEKDYKVTDHALIIFEPPRKRQFKVEIMAEIDPANNKALEGLYQAGDVFVTQCESQGFRRMTYSLDRPDVLSRYTTTIIANKERFPVLISNGNLVRQRDLPNGEHMIQWKDPIPKPSYLFALVAGDLAIKRDSFKTQSGRDVAIEVYVEKGKEDRVDYSIDCLKRAMRWDEERFGREYDLDHLKVVAVSAFNAGAMENKGLLIFNDAALLASPDTAADHNYRWIENVVSHEYFHNWRGNRVTIRNWFELALKEAFTNFTNGEFSADMNSRSVVRIDAAASLRAGQFAEDDGPNAHPIRFPSYSEISNYYTSTVYSKGAEVIGMLQTILGKEGFRKGTDLYFDTYDGQAVTIEELITSLEKANGTDLTQFRTWFDQPGTPQVAVTQSYDAVGKELTLTFTQSQGHFPGLGDAKPWVIPLRTGLLAADGTPLSFTYNGTTGDEQLLMVKRGTESLTLRNVESKPVLSLNRGFSAPVKLTIPSTTEELIVQLAHDPCGFNRYEAGRRLAIEQINAICADLKAGKEPSMTPAMEGVLSAFRAVLLDDTTDAELRSEILSLPSLSELIQDQRPVDVQNTYLAKRWFSVALGRYFEEEAVTVYTLNDSIGPFSASAEAQGRRAIRNRCLARLGDADHAAYQPLLLHAYEAASNLTARLGALAILCREACDERDTALADFYSRYKDDPIVLNKWFALQAGTYSADVLDKVRALEQLDTFDKENPNQMRSLYGAFAHNLPAFHAADGSGYAFLADKIIEIDRYNPHMAGRFATTFRLYPHLDEDQRRLMSTQLRRIQAQPDVSEATREIVAKTLAS